MIYIIEFMGRSPIRNHKVNVHASASYEDTIAIFKTFKDDLEHYLQGNDVTSSYDYGELIRSLGEVCNAFEDNALLIRSMEEGNIGKSKLIHAEEIVVDNKL